jgi:hypothetical protein
MESEIWREGIPHMSQPAGPLVLDAAFRFRCMAEKAFGMHPKSAICQIAAGQTDTQPLWNVFGKARSLRRPSMT